MTVSGLDIAKPASRLELVDLIPVPRSVRPASSRTRRKMVLCASTGGHLAQLVRLSEQFNLDPDSLWITFDSPQSRSLLAGCRTLFVPYVKPRDWKAMARAGMIVYSHVGNERFDEAVSTGAAVAVGAFGALALKRIPLTYIESVSRVEGPSLTGRILAASRLVRMHTQHRSWEGGRWTYKHCVLDSYRSELRPTNIDPKRIFVTLGTIQPYRFDAAVDAVERTGLTNDATQWQLGVTSRVDLPGTTHELVAANDFAHSALEADVVVTHAGVGTLLQLLDLGICPVALIRRSARGEHIDDHQVQIARLLSDRGLAIVCEVNDLTADHLREAGSTKIVSLRERVDPGVEQVWIASCEPGSASETHQR